MPLHSPEAEETAIALALIARERAEARTGLAVFAGIVLAGATIATLLSVFIIHRSAPYSVPLVVVVGFVALGLLWRIGRVVRAYLQARRLWVAGRLSNGEPAADAARRFIAAQSGRASA